MAKIQLLAVVSLDGCISDSKGDARWALNPEKYGINEIRMNASYDLSPDLPITRLIKTSHQKDSTVLVEADKENLAYIHLLMQNSLVDEIILYTYPVFAGTGLHLFGSNLPMSLWELMETQCYKLGVTRSIFHRSNPVE